MAPFVINQEILTSGAFSPFYLAVGDFQATAIYSDPDIQNELVQDLRSNTDIPVFDHQDGLYMRLTVENNIAFFHKWFGCREPISEILVRFELQHDAKKPLHKCSESEIRRVCFAKYYMSGVPAAVFCEPIHGADIKTIHTFVRMLQTMKEQAAAVLILVSNLEHALLVGDVVYKLQPGGIKPVETEEDAATPEPESAAAPAFAKLFKISAKVDEKMILFDPPEIDYIESQDGKAMIVINNEKYAMDATMLEIEKKLEAYGFYRCHRSYIVNLQKVREIITWSKNAYSLRIDNKIQSTIPLSRTKIQDIQEKFNLE